MMTSSRMNWIAAAFAMMTVACSSPAAPPAVTPGMSEVSGAVPAGAVVSLQPTSGEEPLPAGPAVMDQYSKRFEPAVLYVRVGQPVEFRNSEDMPHNVTVTRRGPGTTIFNVGTEPQQKYTHTFDRPGQYDVLCDVHPGMQATLIAANSSRATVADESGKFSLTNVPVGEHTMRVTFEGRTVEQPVSVTGARTEVRVR
jgi:plastocyanin